MTTPLVRKMRWRDGKMEPDAVDYELDNIVKSVNDSATSTGTQSILTAATETGLASSRKLTGTSGQITLTDNGAGSTEVISIPDPFNSAGVVNIPNTKLQIATNQVLPILQIVIASSNTTATVTTATFSNSGLTLSITPKFSTSKILLYTSGNMSNTGDEAYLTLARGGTNLAGTTGFAALLANNHQVISVVYYDSPATTSAITYSVQIRQKTAGLNVSYPTADFSATPTATFLAIEIAQ